MWFFFYSSKHWYLVGASSVQHVAMKGAAELPNLCVFYSKKSAEILIYEVQDLVVELTDFLAVV